MKRDNLLIHALVAFAIALLLYLTLYAAIEHRRNRKGPWQVTFTANATGDPAIIINQPMVGVTNVQISFIGETNSLTNDSQPMHFGEARAVPFDVPFGKCLFLDTTFLPGTVVLKLFGHEIQLLPRVLTIDDIEHTWLSGQTITLSKTLTNPPAKSSATADGHR